MKAPGASSKTSNLLITNLITNKVTSKFLISLCTPISHMSFSRPTAFSRFPTKSKLQRGSTLIEVLVSVGILGLGIGGVMATQTMGLRNNQSAFFRTQANILLSDMGDRLRNNSSVARSGGYVIDWASEYSASIDCDQSQCNSQQVRQHDLRQWTQEIHRSLPDGEGKITSRDNNVFLIEIRWQDKGTGPAGINACGDASEATFCLAVQVQI